MIRRRPAVAIAAAHSYSSTRRAFRPALPAPRAPAARARAEHPDPAAPGGPCVDLLSSWHTVWSGFLLALPRLVGGLIVLLVVWVLGRAAERSARRLAEGHRFDPGLALLFGQLAKVALFVFGVITALGT